MKIKSMINLPIGIATLAVFTTALEAQVCRSDSGPALDHVVIVVNDLVRAGAAFEQHGFRLKNGRLHRNNLLNRHIKFRDASSIELMTVQGQPGDSMAMRYADLLAKGEGGVYVAFNVDDIEAAARTLKRLELEHRRSSSNPWQFLGFPATSAAAAVFFSSGGFLARDADSLLAHTPAVTGLAEVWLEGGSKAVDMFVKMGARRCGTARLHGGVQGERLGLKKGTIVIVPKRPGTRPRVLGAVLRSDHPAPTIHPHPRFWLRYEPDPRSDE